MLTSTFRACSRSAPSVCPRTSSTQATPTLRRRPRNWWSCWWEGTASAGRVRMACRRRWNRLHPPPAWPQVQGLLSGDQVEPGTSLFQCKEDVGATRELQTSKRRNNICVYQVLLYSWRRKMWVPHTNYKHPKKETISACIKSSTSLFQSIHVIIQEGTYLPSAHASTFDWYLGFAADEMLCIYI